MASAARRPEEISTDKRPGVRRSIRTGVSAFDATGLAVPSLPEVLAKLCGKWVKEWTGVSRKYASQLLENLDREKITQREGDERAVLSGVVTVGGAAEATGPEHPREGEPPESGGFRFFRVGRKGVILQIAGLGGDGLWGSEAGVKMMPSRG
jgi:hypothetical protein